tara:strand:+ start:546 stop:866 length:321 start_codon:yes stop_codon:yes gene_type:complete
MENTLTDSEYSRLHAQFIATAKARGLKTLHDCVTQDDYALAMHLWDQMPPADQAIHKLSNSQSYQNYIAALVIHTDRKLFVDAQNNPQTPTLRFIGTNRRKIGPNR